MKLKGILLGVMAAASAMASVNSYASYVPVDYSCAPGYHLETNTLFTRSPMEFDNNIAASIFERTYTFGSYQDINSVFLQVDMPYNMEYDYNNFYVHYKLNNSEELIRGKKFVAGFKTVQIPLPDEVIRHDIAQDGAITLGLSHIDPVGKNESQLFLSAATVGFCAK